MADHLVDTDVLVDHLRGAHALRTLGRSFAYSVVTRCELFAGSAGEEKHLRLLLHPFDELPVDRPVAELAGQLRRSSHVRTPDALIAATALRHGLRLLTRNACDFEAVPGLTVVAPDRS